MAHATKVYLGDGAYVDVEDGAIVLTAENGIRVTDRIVLELEVFAALVAYVQRLQRPTPDRPPDGD